MLEGLEILIKRMDTNPDEFLEGHWDYFTDIKDSTYTIFTQEELDAFERAKEKLQAVKLQRRRERFTEQVITRIFETDHREVVTNSNPYNSKAVTDIIRQGVEKMQQGVTYNNLNTLGYNITTDSKGRKFINGVLV